MNILDKYYGVLLCGCCGDILGSQTEGMSKIKITNKFGELVENMPENKLYTDDTEMTLALATYIIDNYDNFDIIKIHENYANFITNKGYSLSTRNIIEKFKNSNYLTEKEYKNTIGTLIKGNSDHNGAVMRISPLALKYHHNDDQLLANIEYCLYYTHGNNKDSVYSAYLHVKVLQKLLEISNLEQKNLDESINYLFESILVTCSNYETLWLKLNIVKFCKKYGCESITYELLGDINAFQIKAVDAIACAYYIFFTNYNNPLQAVKIAASLGGDTDTIAKLVGEMCGALYGTSWIPEDWKNVENKILICDIAKKLYDKYNSYI